MEVGLVVGEAHYGSGCYQLSLLGEYLKCVCVSETDAGGCEQTSNAERPASGLCTTGQRYQAAHSNSIVLHPRGLSSMSEADVEARTAGLQDITVLYRTSLASHSKCPSP